MAESQPFRGWFGVRCIFDMDGVDADGVRVYEERITMWHAVDADSAIALAEREAAEYAGQMLSRPTAYLGLAQSFQVAGEIGHGAEVFSLIRESPLAPTSYLDRFLDTGSERQQTV